MQTLELSRSLSHVGFAWDDRAVFVVPGGRRTGKRHCQNAVIPMIAAVRAMQFGEVGNHGWAFDPKLIITFVEALAFP